jgi:WD40 repeat protein
MFTSSSPQRVVTWAALAFLLGSAAAAPAQDAEPMPAGALARLGSRFGQIFQADRVALSANGKILATADAGQIRLWNVDDNTLSRRWANNGQGRIHALVLSADAKLVATAGDAFSVIVWDADTGKARLTIAPKPGDFPVPAPKGAVSLQRVQPAPVAWQGPVHSLSLSPDAKLIALGGGAGANLRVWDIAGQKEQFVLKGDKADVTAVAFAPDGRLAAGYGDGVIRLWDLGTGKAHELGKHAGNGIACLAFTPDGKTLASSGGDNDTILLWDVRAGQTRHTLRGERFTGAALAFSADGKILASSSANLKMQEQHPPPHRFGFPPPPRPGVPKGAIAFPPPPPPQWRPSPISPDHTVRLWNVTTGKEIRKLTGHSFQVHTMSLAGGHVVSAANNEPVRLWDLQGHYLRRIGTHAGMIRRVAFAPDGKTLYTSGDDGTIRFWEPRTGKELKQIAKAGGSGTGAFTRDGMLAALIANGGVAGFDLRSGRELFQTAKQENTVAALDYSPDGRVLASGTVRFLRFFDPQGGEQQRLIEAHRDLIIRLAFAPDGKTVATCSWDRTIALWDVATGKERHRMSAQPFPLESVAFSPDGRLLASGCTGGSLRLWHAATFLPVRVVQERSPCIVFGLTFSPDGRFLAASGQDNTVKVWELASGQEVFSFRGHTAAVMSIAFSADSRLMASGGQEGVGFVWDWQKDWRAARGAELDALWRDLAGADAGAAQRAVAALAAGGGKAVGYLKGRLPQVKAASAEQIRQWIADLDSERFATREAAAKRLKDLGRAVEPQLREALKNTDSTEVRRRIEGMLSHIEDRRLTADELRLVRAVQALEQAGSAEARQVLVLLSGGASGPLVQDEARLALKRLETTR